MLAIYKREVRSYFNSMIGCVFAAFLTIIGGVYFMVYNLYSGYPFFAYSLAGVIFMLLISVPVLSMKSFAEDRKNKTDQLLLTSPVSLVEIVLGKYLAMVTVFAIPCVIYCIFPLIIKLQGTAHFLVDYSSILAFFLLGCVFIAIGMFLSSLTESPVIAAITTCAALFFFYLSGCKDNSFQPVFVTYRQKALYLCFQIVSKDETGIYTNRSKSRKQCIDTPRRNAGRYPYVGTC